jgi:hypothetical protein
VLQRYSINADLLPPLPTSDLDKNDAVLVEKWDEEAWKYR